MLGFRGKDIWGLPWPSVVSMLPFNVGAWVQSLVRKLRSHMQKNQDIKQKQYCTNSLKDFFFKRKTNALNSYLECEYLICGINGQGDGRGGEGTKIHVV